MTLKHISVLKNECIENLHIKAGGIYVDATMGGGGHSKAILDKLNKNGRLICFDKDAYAHDHVKPLFNEHDNVLIIKSDFRYLKAELSKVGIKKIDGILFDLGLSSFQIDDGTRGFSYMNSTLLDMRMDKSTKTTALDLLNDLDQNALAKIFYLYGDETKSFLIAKRIIEKRPITCASQIIDITDKVNYKDKGHSAKRVFQALRIAVNDEVAGLEEVLPQAVEMLNPNGYIAVISFHSLEDRIVKHFFKDNSIITYPKGLPIIIKEKPLLEIITKKPILPSEDELENNSRSRSAKLRVAKKN